MKTYATLFALASLFLSFVSADAESFHVFEVDELKFAPDQDGLKEALERSRNFRGFPGPGLPNLELRLPAGVEGYIASRPPQNDQERFQPEQLGSLQIAIRLGGPEVVTGFLDVREGWRAPETQAFAFELDPAGLKAASAEEFEAVRGWHYARLASFGIPGRAWFLQQAGAATDGARDTDPRGRGRGFDSELSQTFAMFSGGRAIAENLALDRELILGRQGGGGDVPLADIDGINVRAIEWSDRLPAEPVAVDALSISLPLDQHAVFIPSVEQLFRLVDLIEREGAPVLGTFDVRNPFRDLPTRYMVQLGISDREILTKLPIKSIAITGGDPFFPTGTDVAALIEIEDVPERAAYIAVLADLVGKAAPGASTLKLEHALAISNSPAQIRRLEAVRSGAEPSLGASDEYHFFRHRYPLAAGGGESAFAFLSDATIRRWGSPRFRIAASRRARAIAALGGLTARKIATGEIGDEFQALLGNVVADEAGRLRSDNFGELGSITPISEMEFETVSEDEKSAYDVWRRGYESGWARVFDPIAIRLDLDEGLRGLDLTVLPLTIDSQYRQWIEVAGDAKLTPMARKPHPESRLFVSFAVDSKSESFREFDTQLIGMLPALKIKPLSWVGESLTVFLEDGFYWKAVSVLGGGGMDSVGQLPVGIRVESNSSIKLALFMGALKGLAETSSPDLLSWETRKHGQRAYVAVIGNGDDIGTEITLYYAALPTALLLSLDEGMLKRAIDREMEVAGLDPAELVEAEHAYGESSPQFLAMLSEASGGGGLADRRRIESWRALPILNEWHRRHGDVAPEEFHRRAFGEGLFCPGGKGYRWNAEAMTMESVAYGHPAAPRDEAERFAVFEEFGSLAAGLGFEDDGLRLWAKLEEAPRVAGADPVVAAAEGVPLGTAHELVPSRPGASYVYDLIMDESKGIQKVEVPEPGEAGEVLVKFTQSLDGGEDQITLTRNSFAEGFGVLGSQSGSDQIRYAPAMMSLPGTLIQGHPVVREYEFESGHGAEMFSGIGEVTVLPVRMETVEVPAGSFENCVRVELVVREAGQGLLTTTRETNWYKAGVGLVKSETSFGRGMRAGAELREFHLPEE